MFADASPDFELDCSFFAGSTDSVDSTLLSLWLWFCFRFKNEGTLNTPFTIVYIILYVLRSYFASFKRLLAYKCQSAVSLHRALDDFGYKG